MQGNSFGLQRSPWWNTKPKSSAFGGGAPKRNAAPSTSQYMQGLQGYDPNKPSGQGGAPQKPMRGSQTNSFMHSVEDPNSPRASVAKAIEDQSSNTLEYNRATGERLFRNRYPGVEPMPDGKSASITGSGDIRTAERPNNNLESTYGYWGVSNHEGEHAFNQKHGDKDREIAPVIGDIVFGAEEFNQREGKPLDARVQMPGGLNQDVEWMRRQAKEHGYWSEGDQQAKSMQGMLNDDAIGKQYLDGVYGRGQEGKQAIEYNSSLEPGGMKRDREMDPLFGDPNNPIASNGDPMARLPDDANPPSPDGLPRANSPEDRLPPAPSGLPNASPPSEGFAPRPRTIAKIRSGGPYEIPGRSPYTMYDGDTSVPDPSQYSMGFPGADDAMAADRINGMRGRIAGTMLGQHAAEREADALLTPEQRAAKQQAAATDARAANAMAEANKTPEQMQAEAEARRIAADGPSYDNYTKGLNSAADSMKKKTDDANNFMNGDGRRTDDYGARNIYGPYGEQDAANFNRMKDAAVADQEADKKAQIALDDKFRDNLAKSDDAIMSGKNPRTGKEQRAIVDPGQMRADSGKLNGMFAAYKRKGGTMKFREWAQEADSRGLIGADARTNLQNNYPGIFDNNTARPSQSENPFEPDKPKPQPAELNAMAATIGSDPTATASSSPGRSSLITQSPGAQPATQATQSTPQVTQPATQAKTQPSSNDWDEIGSIKPPPRKTTQERVQSRGDALRARNDRYNAAQAANNQAAYFANLPIETQVAMAQANAVGGRMAMEAEQKSLDRQMEIGKLDRQEALRDKTQQQDRETQFNQYKAQIQNDILSRTGAIPADLTDPSTLAGSQYASGLNAYAGIRPRGYEPPNAPGAGGAASQAGTGDQGKAPGTGTKEAPKADIGTIKQRLASNKSVTQGDASWNNVRTAFDSILSTSGGSDVDRGDIKSILKEGIGVDISDPTIAENLLKELYTSMDEAGQDNANIARKNYVEWATPPGADYQSGRSEQWLRYRALRRALEDSVGSARAKAIYDSRPKGGSYNSTNINGYPFDVPSWWGN